ncbi:MAG: TlyA family RNA methyltransferase [Candidatus Tritonobacter lacicola]|nr:TlyA family RNA methyltransferase [Candidatus Tritonobacter lacicola]
MKTKKRLDVLLAERGFFRSREAARRAVMAGEVRVRGERVTKPARQVEPGSEISVEERRRYVGRGGGKLEHAISSFGVDPAGKVAVDIGASTGGFTDCLLQHGAALVYAVDVGRGLIDFSLRRNDRVRLMEGVNARYLRRDSFPGKPLLATIDVSFISLEKILPAVRDILDEKGEVIALIKPQFEAGRREVSKGGVVRDPAVRASVVEKIKKIAGGIGFAVKGVVESPLRGPAGNVEYLIHLEMRGPDEDR